MNVVASAEASITLGDLLGVLITLGVVVVLLIAADWLLLRRYKDQLSTEERAPRQIALVALTVVGLAAVLLALPVGSDNRQMMIGLFGLIISAGIALSSSSFLSNAMAGLMLRSVGSFQPGDFIRSGEQFGRVTERGLFHTEIQTRDRDLTTLPNLYLVQNPLTVVRKSGTIVSATLSLGYDIPHGRIEELLKQAAERTDLSDPFVRILELGDYSVVYRVAGFLEDTRQLLSTRSKLRGQILDCLHAAGIEIVSPSFMNQRQVPEPVIAETPRATVAIEDDAPETVIFDKADQAAELADLQKERKALAAQMAELEANKDAGQAGAIERLRRALAVLDHRIEAAEQARKDDSDD